jgi:hypothetical protein
MVERKPMITYTRDFLLSRQTEAAATPNLPIIEGMQRTDSVTEPEEMKRYAPPQRRQQQKDASNRRSSEPSGSGGPHFNKFNQNGHPIPSSAASNERAIQHQRQPAPQRFNNNNNHHHHHHHNTFTPPYMRR